jgi:ketosteroid isomerase-like protein
MAAPATWLKDMYEDVDASRGPDVLARFAPEIELQFGARPAVTGVEEARRTLMAVHENFVSVSHRFVNVWEQGDTTICEFVATYLLASGERVPLPTLTILRREGDRIASMRVYMDEGPLRPHL